MSDAEQGMSDAEGSLLSHRLSQVLAKAISINVGQLRKGEVVKPWTLFRLQNSNQYSLAAFGNPDFDQAKADAKSRITGDAALLDAYVFGYSGQLATAEGEETTALFYEIAERGQTKGLSYTLGYRIAEGEVLISQSHNGFIGEVENWLERPTSSEAQP